MSTTATPFGLKPALALSGTLRQSQLTIASGFASDIFQYAPVQIAANGTIVPAAAGGRAVGVFLGVEWTATDGRRRVGNTWEANNVGTDIVAYFTYDPTIVYQIQADASLTQVSIGEQFNWTAQTGNTVTGLSSVALDVASSAANAGLRVVGLNPATDNIFGDAFTIVQVQISEHQYVADQSAV